MFLKHASLSMFLKHASLSMVLENASWLPLSPESTQSVLSQLYMLRGDALCFPKESAACMPEIKQRRSLIDG